MSHEKIVRMANQIADFFASYPPAEAEAGIAGHINSFWEPRMRRQLFDHLAEGGEGLRDVVVRAAEQIRKPPPSDGAGYELQKQTEETPDVRRAEEGAYRSP